MGLSDPDDYPSMVSSIQSIYLPIGTKYWEKSLWNSNVTNISLNKSCNEIDEGLCSGDCMNDKCCIWNTFEFTRMPIHLSARRVMLI